MKTLVDFKGLTTVYDAWKKLKSTYQNIIPMNQVHLMRWGNDNYKLEESKSTAAHIALFSSILSQVQDSGLCACDDKLKDIF